MAGRRKKVRYVGLMPEYVGFAPEGAGSNAEATVTLTLDELESVRLIDLEGARQADAAQAMGVARATVAGIYEQARHKLADAVVNGKRLVVSGGDVEFHPAAANPLRGWPQDKGEKIMRVAVTYQDGQVFQHFGRTEQFKVYDVEAGKVTSSSAVGSNGVSHGALAGLLAQGGVDVLICGGIGGGAMNALAGAGIKVYPGAEGSADEAMRAFLAGTLPQFDGVTCGGHEHGDGCGHGGHGGCGHGDHEHGEGCGCH